MGAGLSNSDRSNLVELERSLADFTQPTHHPSLMRQLRELYGTGFVARWILALDDQNRVGLGEVQITDEAVPKSYFTSLDAGLKRGELSFLFSVRVPERAQQNRGLVIPGAWSVLEMPKHEYAKLGVRGDAYEDRIAKLEGLVGLMDRYGVANDHQLRTLICDGPYVLCYFIAMQPQAFTPRQRRVDRAATELMRRRLLADHRLNTAQLMKATFDVAIEALGRAAFLMDGRGNVLHANALGMAALDGDPRMSEVLSSAVLGVPTPFEVVSIVEPGTPARYLAMRRQDDIETMARAFAAGHGLGVRATEVLLQLTAGETAKSIALRLGISENTVEYHATRIYRRSGVSSRSELQHLLVDRLLSRRVK